MSKIKIGGVTYTLTDAPLRKDVLRLRRMQNSRLFEILDLSTMQSINEKERGNVDVDKLLKEQILADPSKLAAFTEMEGEAKILGTIVLVTGLSADEINNMPFVDSETLYTKCVDVLGGDMTAFFLDSPMSTSSPASEAGTTTQTAEPDCGISTLENPLESLLGESKTGPEDTAPTTSD